MTTEQKNAIRNFRRAEHRYGEIAGTLWLTKNQVSADEIHCNTPLTTAVSKEQ